MLHNRPAPGTEAGTLRGVEASLEYRICSLEIVGEMPVMYIHRLLRGSQQWLGALLVVAGLAACSQAPTLAPATTAPPPIATAQPTTPSPQPATPPATAVQPTVPVVTPTLKATTPVSAGSLAAVFAGLDKTVSGALGVPVTAGEAVFRDFITDRDVSSYRLTAKGTGANLQNMGAISDKIESMFATLGWAQDVTYGATGMVSSTIGYRQGKKLAVVMVTVNPSADANCPKGTPIMNCKLRPEQTLFTITLECMLRE